MVRVFRPGLLSIIGTSGPFALTWLFLTTQTSTHSGGSESSLAAALGFAFGIVIGAWGLLVLSFAIVLFVDSAHSRIWGPIVAFLYGIGYIPLLILIGAAYSSDLRTAIIGITGTTTYVLGFAGGVWGFFARSSWTPLGFGKSLVGSTGRVFLGGVVSFVSSAVLGVSIYLLAPFVLVVGLLLLRFEPRKRRTVGAILLAASLANALPFVIVFPYLFLRFGGLAGYDSDVPSFLAIVIGGVLAGSGALQLVRRRPMDPQRVDTKPF